MENGMVNLFNTLPTDRFCHAVICLTDYTPFRQRITAQPVDAAFCKARVKECTLPCSTRHASSRVVLRELMSRLIPRSTPVLIPPIRPRATPDSAMRT